MSEDIVLVAKRADGLAAVTMNRPQVHNALDDRLILRLTEVFEELGRDSAVRFVTLTGAGKSFCAGGDIDYLRRCGEYTEAQNFEEGMNLARMLRTIYELPKPVIGLVNGAAYGGGLGMTTVCDVAVGVKAASFTLSGSAAMACTSCSACAGVACAICMPSFICSSWLIDAIFFCNSCA